MHTAIKHSVEHDVAGLIFLAKKFESQSEALKKDVEFLTTKIRDLSYHSGLISKAFADRMNELKVKSLEKDSFIATLTDINGRESVTYR